MKMISDIFLLCFDVLVTVICVPLILLFLAPFQLYKSGVQLLAKILHPEFVPLGRNDAFTVWDAVMPINGRHVYNVGGVIRVNGIINVQTISDRIWGDVLSQEVNGHKLYPRLFEQFALFGGFVFRKKLAKFDLDLQIREVKVESESLAAFKADWIDKPYEEGQAPWEIIVIPQLELGETTFLLKIHHAVADAYSLLYLFDTFLNNKLPKPPPEPKDPLRNRTRQFFGAIRIATGYIIKVLRASRRVPWKSRNTELPSYVCATSLYFPDIKLIQRKTGASYTSIMLSIFGGVLSRVLEEAEDSNKNSTLLETDNTATFVQLSFPWPNHPLSELCNHWTSGGIRVPLGKHKAIKRLKETEADYQDFLRNEVHKVMKRFLFPIGAMMPVKLFAAGFESAREFCGLRTILTSVLGYNENYYEFDGLPVISLCPLTSLLGTTPVMTGLAFAYKDLVQCSFIASSEVAKDQDMMDRIVQAYFAEEVEKLVQQLEEF